MLKADDQQIDDQDFDLVDDERCADWLRRLRERRRERGDREWSDKEEQE